MKVIVLVSLVASTECVMIRAPEKKGEFPKFREKLWLPQGLR